MGVTVGFDCGLGPNESLDAFRLEAISISSLIHTLLYFLVLLFAKFSALSCSVRPATHCFASCP